MNLSANVVKTKAGFRPQVYHVMPSAYLPTDDKMARNRTEAEPRLVWEGHPVFDHDLAWSQANNKVSRMHVALVEMALER